MALARITIKSNGKSIPKKSFRDFCFVDVSVKSFSSAIMGIIEKRPKPNNGQC